VIGDSLRTFRSKALESARQPARLAVIVTLNPWAVPRAKRKSVPLSSFWTRIVPRSSKTPTRVVSIAGGPPPEAGLEPTAIRR